MGQDGEVTDGRVTRRVLARRYLSAWIGFSAGGRFSQALATVIVLFAFGQPTVTALVGRAGVWAVLVTLFVLASSAVATCASLVVGMLFLLGLTA